MSVSLNNKVAIITGASSGIGTSTAHKLASSGCTVILAARRKERLTELHQAIQEAGGSSLVCTADVTDSGSVQELIDFTIQNCGRIDVLINNAGHAIDKPVHESTVDELTGQIESNLNGVVYGCHAVAPHMIEQKTGHIINIGSICSVNHYPNYSAYVAAKFGVLGFSRSFYEEVRPYGIRVQTLCPAAVNTAWADLAGAELPWPREERLQPDDLAEMIYFCLTAPARVHIESIVAWPVCEPTV